MKSRRLNNEYILRIDKAVKYIEKNLDKNIGLNSIANASHFSPYHFHRIFHAMVGETVNDFISRKRMEAAANRLVCNVDLSITEVAELGGFSSSANFSKAFKLYFGITPRQLRGPVNTENSKIGKLFSKYGKEFNPRDLYSQFVTNKEVFDPDKLEELLMNVKVKEFEEKRIAFLTSPKGYDLNAIFETWDKLAAWAECSGIEDDDIRRYAICHDNPMVTPIDKCRYDASMEVDDNMDVLAPFSTTTIPAGKYAVAPYKGDGDKVSNFYMELYSHWLPNSGFEPDNYPPISYCLNDSRKDGFVEMEVMIKLKELK